MAIKRNIQPWGDSIDTIKHSKPLDEWYVDKKPLPYNFFKLPDTYSFDLHEMRRQVSNLLEQQQTIQIIVDLMAKRPRFNLSSNHFTDSYTVEIKLLEN